MQTMLAPTPLPQLLATATAMDSDLRNLCAESRRKHPELQSAAERAMVKLRALQLQLQSPAPPAGPPAKSPVEVLQSDSVLRPLLLACGSQSPARLSTLALGSIQRLVSLQPLSGRLLSTVMGALRIQAESDDPQVQLKILQTLLLTISPAAVECGELLQGSLLQALGICFRLWQNKKSPAIHHTAFAALRQLVTLLFDRLTWQSQRGTLWVHSQSQSQTASAAAAAAATPADPPQSATASLLPAPLDQLSYEAQNAYLLFQDLCILSAGSADAPAGATIGSAAAAASASQRPRWLTNLISSSIPAEMCIELLENIVSSTPKLFAEQPLLFAHLIKRDLCGLLVRLLRSHFDFAIVLRLIRTILVLTRHFHALLRDELDMFLQLFIRMLHAEFPLWHRVLVLEAVLQMLHINHDKFAYWLFHTYDLTPQQIAAANTKQADATTTAASAADGQLAIVSQPPPSHSNANQTRIFTSLLHALSKIVIQTGTALSENSGGGGGGGVGATNGAGLSGGSSLQMAVGSSGLSSSSSALLTQSVPTPPVAVTVPTSPSAGGPAPMQFGAKGGAAVDPPALHWKLYGRSKGNRGLDLLNLEQESVSGSSGSSSSASSAATAASLYEESYVVTLGIECIVCVVNGLAALARTNEKWGGSHANEASAVGAAQAQAAQQQQQALLLANGAAGGDLPSLDSSLTAVEVGVLRLMATAACLPILGALSFLLSRTNEEAQIQHLLMSYQSFTNTAGVLELTRSRDAFLLNLCAFALPNNGLPRDEPPSEIIKNLFGSGAGSALAAAATSPEARAELTANVNKILLSAKNLQSLKALFNISHCLSDDSRVLTSRGFMFHDEVERAIVDAQESAGPPLLFACLDRRSQQLVYCPGRLVQPPAPVAELVEFSDEVEQQRWGSNGGLMDDEVFPSPELPIADSDRVSLLVDAQHSLFVQTGCARPTADGTSAVDWSLQPAFQLATSGSLLPEACECRADAVDPCDHRGRTVRLLSAAQGGYCVPSDLKGAAMQRMRAQLDLQTQEQLCAFLQLYGFWLARGALRPDVDAVSFERCSDSELAFLREVIPRAGLRADSDWTECSIQHETSRSVRVDILASRWFALFRAEYSDSHPDPLPAAPESLIDGARGGGSAEWLFPWMLSELGRADVLAVLLGLRVGRGATVQAADQSDGAIDTTSVRMRDELIRMLLHAGASACFDAHTVKPAQTMDGLECSHAGSSPTPSVWRVRWSTDRVHPELLIGRSVRRRSYHRRVWCVTVDHGDHLIFVQRAHRDEKSGAVRWASRPLVVGNCLGSYLGSGSWLSILDTFQTLDTMIHVAGELNYRLSRDHALHDLYQQSLVPHQAEINIMAAALGRLFESTRFLDDRAVTHVLSALGTLSLSSLANAATSEGNDGRASVSTLSLSATGHAHSSTHPSNVSSLQLSLQAPQTIRMFALVNLIATLEHNMFRITAARLWEIGIGHLTCVINHKDAAIRSFGVAALTKIAILAIAKPTTYLQPQSAQAEQSGGGGAAAGGGGAAADGVAVPSSASTSPPPTVAKLSSATSKSIAALAAMDPADYKSAIQSSLLEPFSDLARGSKYEDTRENILMSVFQILQNCGQHLVRGGWKVVLAILQAVVQGQQAHSAVGQATTVAATATEPDAGAAAASTRPPSSSSPPPRAASAPSSSASASASFINVGFNSVQLIANDYLESIPFESLANLIQTIAAYCAQISDTNISFTSIGLLWRVSDYVQKTAASNRARSSQEDATAGGSDADTDDAAGAPPVPSVAATATSTVASSPSPSPVAAAVLSASLADSLMHLVFTSLVSLSVDSRTEVRNSAVKTLHNTLVAHAARMPLSTCVQNLSALVLPLLQRLLVEKQLEDSERNQQLNSTELGKDKATGKAVMMLVHYSRDTASKQWDETRVYALQGTARVVKAYIDNWTRSAATDDSSTSPSAPLAAAFLQQWLRYLDLNLIALANRSPEVTLAALNSVLELAALLLAQANSGATGPTAAGTVTAPAVAAVASPSLPSSSSHPALSSAVSSCGPSLSASLRSALWTAVLERFYIPGVVHALTQHRHVEWVEERERAAELDRKQRRSAGAVGGAAAASVDFADSPFATSWGDLNADEGWKSWLKTYTHLLGNLQTLLPMLRRAADAGALEPLRDDSNVIVQLSHAIVRMHSEYTEQRARQIYAQRKRPAGAAAAAPTTAVPSSEPTLVDRKETPVQAAHLKLLESLCSSSSSTGVVSLSGPSSLSPQLWDSVFAQLLSYLVSDHSGNDIGRVEAQLIALLHADGSTSAPTATSAVESAAAHSRAEQTALLEFASTSFAKKVVRVLDRLYTGVAPASVRAAHFSPVLGVLQRVIEGGAAHLCDEGYQELCEEAVAALIHILDSGLSSINDRMAAAIDTDDEENKERERMRVRNVWDTLVQIFAAFLSPPSSPASSTAMAPPTTMSTATHSDHETAASSSPSSSSSSVAPPPGVVLLPLRSSLAPAQQRVWENLQIALIGCLVRIVLPQVAHAPDVQTVRRLVSFFSIGYSNDQEEQQQHAHAQVRGGSLPPDVAALDSLAGVSLAPATHELLSHSCLMALFQLSRAGTPSGLTDSSYSNHMLVASLAAPLLLHRCRTILRTYLAIERLQPASKPMPRCRREEMGFVLRELGTLQMHPHVADATRGRGEEGEQKANENDDTGTVAAASAVAAVASPLSSLSLSRSRSRPVHRGHLLQLFPVLCQCITMREPELRELLRDVFELAAIELGLQQEQTQEAQESSSSQ